MKISNLKKIITVTSFLTLSSVAVAKEPMKVGFLYAQQIGDYGWTYEHELARQKVDKKLGDDVSTDYVITDSQNVKSTIDSMVKNKYDMIVSTTDAFKKEMLDSSRVHVKVKFLSHMSDFETKNLSGYTVRNEGFYLAGMASAQATKTNVIGTVGLSYFPAIFANINAFALGAQSVNPDIKLKVIWLDLAASDEDVVEAVRELKRQGADTVFQQTGGVSFVTTAEEEGLWVIGFNGPTKKYAPKKYFTSIINNWSSYYKREIEDALNGRWASKNTWAGYNQGMIKMTSLNSQVTADKKNQIRDMRAKMIKGAFNIFTGPISYADGEVFLKDGEVARYYNIIKMNKFFKGVDDITK